MDYSKMTDEELYAELERLFGEDWNPKDIDPESELLREYTKRVSTGI